MGDLVPFGGSTWWWLFAALFITRGADLFSTWVATPNLLLEANPVARWLGWKWAIPLNLTMTVLVAFFVLPAVIIATTSALVAARNFQQAWLMRTLGEENYRLWHQERLMDAPIGLFLSCLGFQNLLVSGIGFVLAWSSFSENQILLIPFGIGVGLINYAAAVMFFTLLSIWRMRRHWS